MYYNAVMRGLAEYYKLGVLWKAELSPVHHIWWFSLMKTLARKHKCSVKKLFQRVLDHNGGEYGLWYETKNGRQFMAVFTLKLIKGRVIPNWENGLSR